VLDTDLAERLGMARPTNIRTDLILPNRAELESFGTLQETAASSPMPNGGFRKVTAYFLNEEQALLDHRRHCRQRSEAFQLGEVRGVPS
jgi:hypothetical protein